MFQVKIVALFLFIADIIAGMPDDVALPLACVLGATVFVIVALSLVMLYRRSRRTQNGELFTFHTPRSRYDTLRQMMLTSMTPDRDGVVLSNDHNKKQPSDTVDDEILERPPPIPKRRGSSPPNVLVETHTTSRTKTKTQCFYPTEPSAPPKPGPKPTQLTSDRVVITTVSSGAWSKSMKKGRQFGHEGHNGQ